MQIGLALWRELEQPTAAGKLYAQTAAQMLLISAASMPPTIPPSSGILLGRFLKIARRTEAAG
jgi:hypothetical protein